MSQDIEGSAVQGAIAGRLANYIDYWRTLTSDPNILDMVSGCHLEFVDNTPPVQTKPPWPLPFNDRETEIVDTELDKLLAKGVVAPAEHCDGEFISNIFLRKKRDGSFRTILNLKDFNHSIPYHHFKMETLQSAIKLMRPGCYMASVDLKDAYYTVPIAPEHRKYLRFLWKGNLLEYSALPNGLSCAPLKFTKLLKPIFALLRKMGYVNIGYIDDTYLQGDTPEECADNVRQTVHILEQAGFVIHMVKSVFHPTQQLVFLGFILDSLLMVVRLTPEKAQKLREACLKLYAKDMCTIQTAAELVGLMVASFPGVEMAPLFYRRLEMAKTAALQASYYNFNATMELSSAIKTDLKWWIDNVCQAKKHISHGKPVLQIWSDASNLGWGAKCDLETVGGRWSTAEQEEHINFKELLAGFFAVKSFCVDRRNIHVRLNMDNTTAVAYINAMGGSKSKKCNSLARQVWLWCLERDIWLSTAYVAGTSNIDADHESRVFNDRTEWKLCSAVFQDIVSLWGTPAIDLFASRLNTQLRNFVSWKPDPEASYVDAFSISWTDLYSYAFPPFSLIGQFLHKLEEDGGESILVAPVWATQPWYPQLLQMTVDHPRLLPPLPDLLTLPGTQRRHPLSKLVLAAFKLSGKRSRCRDFQQKLPDLSCLPGEDRHRNNTQPTFKNGFVSVVRNKLIVFGRL